MTKISRNLYSLFIAICVLQTASTGANARSQEITSPIALVIIAPKGAVRSGDPLFIDVVSKNTTKHQVKLGTRKDDLAFTAVDETGRSLPRKQSTQPRASQKSDFHFKSVEGGEKLDEQVRIDGMFDMSKPGTYKISAERKIEPEFGGGSVQSNEITIRVLP